MTDADLTWATAADSRRRVGRAVEFHPTIGSTNDRARELLRAGEPGVAVVADLQTAGRGRHGRTWTSPPGRNLMVSVGLRPAVAVGDAWQLGAASGLALVEAAVSVAALPQQALALKWPNDLVDGDGRKVAGVLLETELAGDRIVAAVIGSGVNVNWPRSERPADLADRAAALCDLAGRDVDRVALLGAYLAALDRRLRVLEAGGSLLDEVRAASWLDGRDVGVEAGDERVAGRVAGVGADGALLLETAGGRRRIAYGEVVRVAAVQATVAR